MIGNISKSKGFKGDRGKKGKDGISPTIKIEQLSEGAKITVTDKNGDTSAILKDGHTPEKGVDYSDGISPSVKIEQTTDGAKITITDRSGTTFAELKDGEKGDKGDAYVLTDTDKNNIADLVLEKIPISFGDVIEYPIDEVV
jgi:hypothetical protein